MRKIPKLATVLITSLVLVLAGLVASPIATASENESVRVSATFPFGSSVLTKTQKAEIKKALASSGSGVSFMVTGVAGKFPGVSDRRVQELAKKRAQAIKAYLLSLGVSETSVTTEAKITKIGVAPKIENVYFPPAPTPTPTVTAVATDSAPAGLTCATGATCVVGDTGPGGGIVYYVHTTTAGFDCGLTYIPTGSPTGGLCKYLEVAPSGWSGVLADPQRLWATGTFTPPASGNVTLDVTGIANEASVNFLTGIGLGYKNSDAIVNQGPVGSNGATTAAFAARAYAGGSKNDWYLPTAAELNLLCQWNRNVTQDVTTVCTGGTQNTGTGSGSGFAIAGSFYWSSSAQSTTNVWNQLFFNGDHFYAFKTGLGYVRPIRAF